MGQDRAIGTALGGAGMRIVYLFLDTPNPTNNHQHCYRYHKFECQTRIRDLRLLRAKVLAIPLHLAAATAIHDAQSQSHVWRAWV